MCYTYRNFDPPDKTILITIRYIIHHQSLWIGIIICIWISRFITFHMDFLIIMSNNKEVLFLRICDQFTISSKLRIAFGLCYPCIWTIYSRQFNFRSQHRTSFLYITGSYLEEICIITQIRQTVQNNDRRVPLSIYCHFTILCLPIHLSYFRHIRTSSQFLLRTLSAFQHYTDSGFLYILFIQTTQYNTQFSRISASLCTYIQRHQ